MLKSMFLVGLAAFGFATTLQAETRVLEPSSHWALDYGTDKCRLTRTFGGEEDRTALIFDQFGPTSMLEAVVAGSALDRMSTERDMEVQFGPYFESWTINSDPSTFGDFGEAILISGRGNAPGMAPTGTKATPLAEASQGDRPTVSDFAQLDPEDGKRIEWIEVRQGSRMARLDTGNLEAPYRALNSCIDDLIATWGFDPVQQRNLASGPNWVNQGEVAQEIIRRSYPRQAVIRGDQAVLHYRVMIDTEGQAEDCVITNVTTADSFDDEPCKIIMRDARFEPARDAQGRAVRSFHASRIRYRMPR